MGQKQGRSKYENDDEDENEENIQTKKVMILQKILKENIKK